MSRTSVPADIFKKLGDFIKAKHKKAIAEGWFSDEPAKKKGGPSKIEALIMALEVRDGMKRDIAKLLKAVSPKHEIREDVVIRGDRPERGQYMHAPGILVVPLTSRNSHNYSIGQPSLIIGGNRGTRQHGKHVADGNNHDWTYGTVRLADNKEIDSFVAALRSTVKAGGVLEFVGSDAEAGLKSFMASSKD
jgi:hypothetical protein